MREAAEVGEVVQAAKARAHELRVVGQIEALDEVRIAERASVQLHRTAARAGGASRTRSVRPRGWRRRCSSAVSAASPSPPPYSRLRNPLSGSRECAHVGEGDDELLQR